MAAVEEAAAERVEDEYGEPPDDEDAGIEGKPPSGGEAYTPTNPDEQRRAFVFTTLANSSYEVTPALEALALYDNWLKTGDLPKAPEKPGSKLAALRGGKS